MSASIHHDAPILALDDTAWPRLPQPNGPDLAEVAVAARRYSGQGQPRAVRIDVLAAPGEHVLFTVAGQPESIVALAAALVDVLDLLNRAQPNEAGVTRAEIVEPIVAPLYGPSDE